MDDLRIRWTWGPHFQLWQAVFSEVSFPKNQVLCQRWCIYSPNEKALFLAKFRSLTQLDLVTRTSRGRPEALWTNRLQLSLREDPLHGRLHLGRIGRQGLGGSPVEIDGDIGDIFCREVEFSVLQLEHFCCFRRSQGTSHLTTLRIGPLA